eukprot:10556267-Alexandrium_andersonii.AAC.1
MFRCSGLEAMVTHLLAATRAPMALRYLKVRSVAHVWSRTTCSGPSPSISSMLSRRSSARTLGLACGTSLASALVHGTIKAASHSMDHGSPCGMLHSLLVAMPIPAAYTLRMARVSV